MKMCMILIAVVSASVMVDIVSHTLQAANQSALLDRQAKGATLQNVLVDQAVVNALLDSGAPGGVALSDCNESVTHNFFPHDSSLRGILDSIVSTEPRVTWEIKKKRRGRRKTERSSLTTPIKGPLSELKDFSMAVVV